MSVTKISKSKIRTLLKQGRIFNINGNIFLNKDFHVKSGWGSWTTKIDIKKATEIIAYHLWLSTSWKAEFIPQVVRCEREGLNFDDYVMLRTNPHAFDLEMKNRRIKELENKVAELSNN